MLTVKAIIIMIEDLLLLMAGIINTGTLYIGKERPCDE